MLCMLRKKSAPLYLEKKQIFSLVSLAQNSGKLCCYEQMKPSLPSSGVRHFSMCTNYFRLLLGDIGESLTFLHLFKFNHWNKHLKTHRGFIWEHKQTTTCNRSRWKNSSVSRAKNKRWKKGKSISPHEYSFT